MTLGWLLKVLAKKLSVCRLLAWQVKVAHSDRQQDLKGKHWAHRIRKPLFELQIPRQRGMSSGTHP